MKRLVIFDLDDTLFFTFAKILVVKDGKVVKELTNQEFNNYQLQEGESFDFSQFKDSDLFVKTSIPHHKLITLIKKYHSNPNNQVCILTARANFYNKDKLIKYLRDYGIEVGHKDEGKIHLIRAGEYDTGNVALNKINVLNRYFNVKEFDEIIIFDDNKQNLKTLKKELRNKTICYLVKKNKIKII